MSDLLIIVNKLDSIFCTKKVNTFHWINLVALKGSYCLSIIIDSEITVNIGSLGNLTFGPGEYVYVGSALKGIESRVRRHMNTSEKKSLAMHWHIDYLLNQRNVHLKAVHGYISDERLECKIAESLAERFQTFRGFGSSDCRCKGHLFKIERDWDPMDFGNLAKHPVILFQE